MLHVCKLQPSPHKSSSMVAEENTEHFWRWREVQSVVGKTLQIKTAGDSNFAENQHYSQVKKHLTSNL